jgi:hypothetical protein
VAGGYLERDGAGTDIKVALPPAEHRAEPGHPHGAGVRGDALGIVGHRAGPRVEGALAPVAAPVCRVSRT